MIQLQRPCKKMVPSYLDFIEEMRGRGEKVWEGNRPEESEAPEVFVRRLLSRETSPKEGMIAESIYWAVYNGQVAGRIALRHALNENLKEFGGHIGYEVRPSLRGKGIATAMLKEILRTSKAKEIGKILLTCAPDNIGSNRTILANGGVLARTAYVQKWNRETNYYWIDLSQ